MIIQCGKYQLDLEQKTYIMGIVNVTPDSFSDGGNFNEIDRALYHAEQLVKDGADILDIGGESTRPNAQFVSVDEELTRVIPIIEKLQSVVDVPISIDTYKAIVAREAIAKGASIINDVWGAKKDADMAIVAANSGVPIILMHNREPKPYENLIRDVLVDLEESIATATAAGVAKENIILDPGIGFAKTVSENLQVMNHLADIVAMGYPVLLGTSRKSMIGQVLDLPVTERLSGTIATNCFGIEQGCQIIRVHDVKEHVQAATMIDAIMGKAVIY